MEGKTIFLEGGARKSDGLTWLTPTPHILRQIYANASSILTLLQNEA